MLKKKIQVAIDSPAGSGAGTQAKLISKYYNLFYLDTGKLYRILACTRTMRPTRTLIVMLVLDPWFLIRGSCSLVHGPGALVHLESTTKCVNRLIFWGVVRLERFFLWFSAGFLVSI